MCDVTVLAHACSVLAPPPPLHVASLNPPSTSISTPDMASQNPGGGGYYGWGSPQQHPQQPHHQQQAHAQYTPTRNIHPAHHPPQQMEPDLPTVLLALADTYISAAHANGYKSSLGTASDADAYCRLVATGLACFETALRVWCALGVRGLEGVLMVSTVSTAATRRGYRQVALCEHIV